MAISRSSAAFKGLAQRTAERIGVKSASDRVIVRNALKDIAFQMAAGRYAEFYYWLLDYGMEIHEQILRRELKHLPLRPEIKGEAQAYEKALNVPVRMLPENPEDDEAYMAGQNSVIRALRALLAKDAP